MILCDYCETQLTGGADTYGKIGQKLCYRCWDRQKERDRTGVLNLNEHADRLRDALFRLSDRIQTTTDEDDRRALETHYAWTLRQFTNAQYQMNRAYRFGGLQ